MKNNFLRAVTKNQCCGGMREEREQIRKRNVMNFLIRIKEFISHTETENVFLLIVLDRINDSPDRRLARSWFNRSLLSKERKYAFTTRSGKWVLLWVVDIRHLTAGQMIV